MGERWQAAPLLGIVLIVIMLAMRSWTAYSYQGESPQDRERVCSMVGSASCDGGVVAYGLRGYERPVGAVGLTGLLILIFLRWTGLGARSGAQVSHVVLAVTAGVGMLAASMWPEVDQLASQFGVTSGTFEGEINEFDAHLVLALITLIIGGIGWIRAHRESDRVA